jgi:ribonuclease HI
MTPKPQANPNQLLTPVQGGSGGVYCDGGLEDYDFFQVRGRAIGKVNLSSKISARKTVKLYSQTNTCIESEFLAILLGLTYAIKKNRKLVLSDNEWCVETINGINNASEPRLKLMAESLRALYQHWGITLKWVPREENLAT